MIHLLYYEQHKNATQEMYIQFFQLTGKLRLVSFQRLLGSGITSWHLKSLRDSSGKNWLSAYCCRQAITLDLPQGRTNSWISTEMTKGKVCHWSLQEIRIWLLSLSQFWVEVALKCQCLHPWSILVCSSQVELEAGWWCSNGKLKG